MRVIILDAAEEEREKAIAYYEGEKPGLGKQLEREFLRAIEKIVDQPRAWPKLSRNIRCCRTRRFKYGVLYSIRRKLIVIVAFMHLSRRPGYWKDRL